MNFNEVALSIGGIVVTIIGWSLKETMDEIKQHRQQLATLHEHYVKKDDFKEFKQELWVKLDELKEDVKASR